MLDSDKLFYSYSQIYQLSYALPIYRVCGGTFLVKNLRQWVQFKKYMRGLRRPKDAQNILNTPPVKLVDPNKKTAGPGIIITPSVERFYPDSKDIIHIYIGHGSGDKPYFGHGVYEKMGQFNYHFLAGPKNLEKLKDKGVSLSEDKLVKIGNMRFDDYVTGRIDRARELDRLGIKNRHLKNILFAPTWKWGHGSLLNHVNRFCREISPQYNLIIRPHGHERMKIPRLRRWVKRNGHENIYFSNPSHLARHDTMHDFIASDLMISDRTSSIIYEYLITGKPIIVIENDFDQKHKMPEHMTIDGIAASWEEASDILKLIENSFALHQKKLTDYRNLLERCFYHNDGKSTQRAVEFIDGIIKRIS
jgi:hypothetical protein